MRSSDGSTELARLRGTGTSNRRHDSISAQHHFRMQLAVFLQLQPEKSTLLQERVLLQVINTLLISGILMEELRQIALLLPWMAQQESAEPLPQRPTSA